MALSRAQIQVAFQNSLGRAASASDENSYFSVSQSGALTDAQIFSTISNSREADQIADPVIRFYQAAFGRVPDQAGLQNAENFVRALGPSAATYQNLSNMFAQSTEFTNRFGTGTAVDAAYVQALYSTILGRTASSGEVDGYVNSAGATRGGVLYLVSQSQEAISISNDAVNGFQLNAAQGTAVYTGSIYTAQNGGSTGPSNGSTFALTTGVDTLAGTANADTFNGVVNAETPVQATLTAADSINGAAGIDSINITATGANANALPAANITNVENFFIRDVAGAGGTYDFGTVAGEQQVWSDRSTQAVTFSNVGTSSTAGTAATVGIRGDGTAVVGNVAFTTATLTDKVSIAIDGGVGTTGTLPTITNTGAQTATSASISSTGAANKVGVIDLVNTNSNLTALSVNAASNLTATLAANDFDVAGAALTVSGAAAAVNLGTLGVFKTIDASGLTAGGLTVGLNAVTTSFTGGQGNDVVTTAALTTTTASAINAGAGTGDTLIVNATTDVDTAIEAKLYAGFEVLQNAGQTVDLDLFTNSTFTSLRAGGGTTVFNNVNATQAQNVTVTASDTLTLAVKNATVSGNLDTVKLTIDDGVATKGAITLTTPTLAGVETLSIVGNEDTTITALTGATSVTNFTETGAGNASVTTGAVDFAANSKFDFSGTTGTVTFSAAAAQTGAGSAGLAITGSATNTNTLTGSIKADVVIGGVKSDTYVSTGGNDVITLGGAGDTTTVSTGGQNLTFNYANTDSVSKAGAATGFDGTVTDTITGILTTATFADGAAGTKFTLNTVPLATAVTTGASVTLGTTTVANANDFFVSFAAGGGVTDAFVYQDTNGNKTIDAGDFAVKLVGTAGGFTAGEFAITNGHLVYTSAT